MNILYDIVAFLATAVLFYSANCNGSRQGTVAVNEDGCTLFSPPPGIVSKYSIVEYIVVDDGAVRYIGSATFSLAQNYGETLLGIKKVHIVYHNLDNCKVSENEAVFAGQVIGELDKSYAEKISIAYNSGAGKRIGIEE